MLAKSSSNDSTSSSNGTMYNGYSPMVTRLWTFSSSSTWVTKYNLYNPEQERTWDKQFIMQVVPTYELPLKPYLLTNNLTPRYKINVVLPLKSFRRIIMNMWTYESHQTKLWTNKVNHFSTINVNWFRWKMPQISPIFLCVPHYQSTTTEFLKSAIKLHN